MMYRDFGEGDEKPISSGNPEDIIRQLHPIEIKVIRAVKSEPIELSQISEEVELSIDAVMWAIKSLEEKGLISVKEEISEDYKLDIEGEYYLRSYFPEQRVVNKLKKFGGECSVEKLNLSEEERRIGLSWAISLSWLTVENRNGTRVLRLTSKGLLEFKDYPPYMLLNKIKNSLELSKEDLKLLDQLKNRGKIIKYVRKKRVFAWLNSKGVEIINLLNKILGENKILDLGKKEIVNELTRDIITSGRWNYVYFRPYDVTAPVKILNIGGRHPYREIIDEIREVLIGLGFEEVVSPPIEVNFWNADALFMPSDHPAREIHDVFYLDFKPLTIKEVASKKEWLRVKKTHENGWKTGSSGWGYWNPELALKRVLRSQTTAVSARCLSQLKDKDLPKKIFTIDRNYRPDKIDATHLMEFNQCEGIVVSRDVNFKHLLGFLKTIAEAFGIKEIKFQPAYFPFTEPSVVGYVKHEKLGWMEALPAGIFRPEVTLPLGIKAPVLAWGLGIDRLAMVTLGIEDIRLLYSNDLNWLRSKKKPSIWGI